MAQKLSEEDAVAIVVRDAATRAGVDAKDVSIDERGPATYPNAALGAPREGEVSLDMVTQGWAIWVTAGTKNFEYRADPRQVRLASCDGLNHLIYPA